MRIMLWILLSLSLALNGFQVWVVLGQTAFIARQMQILKGQHEAIKLSNEGWSSLTTKPVYVMKHRSTGDIFVQVPYRGQPYHFPRVCSRESAL